MSALNRETKKRRGETNALIRRDSAASVYIEILLGSEACQMYVKNEVMAMQVCVSSLSQNAVGRQM